jgi:hypothetical protein
MANRNFMNKIFTLEPDVVELYAVVTIGDTVGTPTLTRGKGFSAVTRDGAGQYHLHMDDTFKRFLGGSIVGLKASAYVGPTYQFEAADLTNKILRFACNYPAAATGTFVDPANSTVIYITARFSNSTSMG